MTNPSLAKTKSREGMVNYKSISIIYGSTKKGCCSKKLGPVAIPVFHYANLMEYLHTERNSESGFREMIAKKLPESYQKLYYREKSVFEKQPH